MVLSAPLYTFFNISYKLNKICSNFVQFCFNSVSTLFHLCFNSVETFSVYLRRGLKATCEISTHHIYIMAKILSPILGRARGILGANVFYHMPKYTGVRQRSQTVRNPQTNTQMAARVSLTTVQRAYSVLKPICDHSHEGRYGQSPNQLMFVANNLRLLRLKYEAESDWNEVYNFNTKPQMHMVVNDYQVSEGTLKSCNAEFAGISGASSIFIPFSGYRATISYDELLQLLGHGKSTQYTFLVVLGDPVTGLCSGIEYCRVIMRPSGGDYSVDFIGDNRNINDPNPKNEGTDKFYFIFSAQNPVYGIAIMLKPEYLAGRQVLGGCMIASKGTGKKALRSTEFLQFNFEGEQLYSSLASAIASYQEPGTSSIYLNQGT